MSIRGRSVGRTGSSLLVALLSVALLGCSAEAPAGASILDSPSPTLGGESSTGSVAPTQATPELGSRIVALPEDLQALLVQLPWVGRTGEGPTVQRFGSAAVSFQTSPEAYTYVDYAATGSSVTVVESKGTTRDMLDVDLTTGGLRLITAIEADGDLLVSRHPTSRYMLVGSLGVDLVDVATGERRQLIKSVMPPELEGGTGRDFLWSPTGRTAAFRLCSVELCVVDIIDTSDWSVRRLPGTHTLMALTDDYAVTYPSLDDRRPRLLDLKTLESRAVAPQLAGAINAYPRDDGGFVLYGVTSWPYVAPVHRPLVLVDPASKTDRVLVDQGPDDWAYPFMEWTSNDWVLLIPELATNGGPPGVRIAVDTRTGARFEFKLDGQGRAVEP